MGITRFATTALLDLKLERYIHDLWAAQESIQEARLAFYGIRWRLTLTNLDLRLANSARIAFAKATRTLTVLPEVWENALGIAVALLRLVSHRFSRLQLAAGAAAVLLSFDIYARGGDAAKILASELRAPRRGQHGALAAWTVTMFPETEAARSKTGGADDTVLIGTTHPRRAWLTVFLAALRTMRRKTSLLFDLTQTQLNDIYNLGRKATGLAKAGLHPLRHGGASADKLAGLAEREMQTRGRWASPKSVHRYRRPGPYMRAMEAAEPQVAAGPANETFLQMELPRRLRG